MTSGTKLRRATIAVTLAGSFGFLWVGEFERSFHVLVVYIAIVLWKIDDRLARAAEPTT